MLHRITIIDNRVGKKLQAARPMPLVTALDRASARQP
jgi:hypothetical protein